MASQNKHLSGRVHKRQVDQLDRISREEKIDRSTALRKVLDIGLEQYNKQKAVEEYRKGRVSIGRAAEIAGVSIAEFYKILEDEDVPLRIDMAGIRQSVESDIRK